MRKHSIHIYKATSLISLFLLCFQLNFSARAQESGYQIINGTRVYTQIDHASDTATFSNECGSQTISHRALAAGAIPNNIIPCPRPSQNSDDNIDKNNKANEAIKRISGELERLEFDKVLKDASMNNVDGVSPNLRKDLSRLYEVARCYQFFVIAETSWTIANAANYCDDPDTKKDFEQYSEALKTPQLSKGPPNSFDVGCSDISGTAAGQSYSNCYYGFDSARNTTNRTIIFRPAHGSILQIGPNQALERSYYGDLFVSSPGDPRTSGTVLINMESRSHCRKMEFSRGRVNMYCEYLRQKQESVLASDDAYRNYMLSYNANSGGQNSGNLGHGALTAAYEVNTELTGTVAWGRDGKAASSAALAACRAISKTCSNTPAVAQSSNQIVSVVCCVNPRFACTAAFADNIDLGIASSKDTLHKSSFSYCKVMKAFDAKYGDNVLPYSYAKSDFER